MAIRLADTARPNNHVDAEHLGTFPVAYAEDVWFEDGTRLSEKTFDGDSIQKEELPLASADEEGNVYQYIGESGTYTHGCFYECIEFRESDGSTSYKWKRLNVIKNPVVSADQPFNVEDYEDKTVIVYSGESLYDLEQGHHYMVKKNISMDLYYLSVTQNPEEPLIAFVKNNPPQVGEHFYDALGFCVGILTYITDVSASFYVFKSQTVETRDNPQLTDITAHFSATDYVDIGGGSDYQFSEDFVNEDNNVSLVPEQRIFTGTQAEWDALSTAVKKTYGQVNITDDESGTPEYYSTEEVKTNKVWIDGKPIYRVVRHVWDTGNVPATGYSFSGTMLSGPLTNNAESLIKVVILCKNTQGSWQELTGNGENGPAQNFVWFNDTSAYFIHAGTLDGAWAIFEYTKTTD